MDFYINAINIRKELTLLMIRDFGIKQTLRDITKVKGRKEMTEEDIETLNKLVEKYHYINVIANYPEWMINKMRENIFKLTSDLIENIVQANSIYPAYEPEYYDRRIFQDHAIGNCEHLLQEMQYIISIIPVDINKYQRYVQMIEREIALLKGWRKNNNKILRNLRKNNEGNDNNDTKDSEDKTDTNDKEESNNNVIY